WNPGVFNPRILKPARPTDPDVPVVYFESVDGKPLAAYVNFAVHLDVVGGKEFSADLPYTLSRLLAEFKGPDMVTVYTTGTCGDVNHINVQWGAQQKGHGFAARMGAILAADVLRTFPKLKPLDPGPLRCASKVVSLPLAKIEPGDVDKAKAVVARLNDRQAKQPAFLETVQAFKVLDVDARKGKPHEAE